MAIGKNKQAPPLGELDKAIAALSEKWDGVINTVPASEYVTCDDLKRPTGLTSLDVALGGGWQGGRLVIISGMSGLGKDYLLNQTIRNVQENYGENAGIVIASFGADHDPTFANLCGVTFPRSEVDIAKMEEENGAPLDPEYKAALRKSVGKIVIPQPGQDPRYLKNPAGFLAEYVIDAVRQGRFQLVVLNEVGSHVTRDLAEKVMSETDAKKSATRAIADTAKFFDHFMAKYCLAMKQSGREFLNETTLMFLSQIRMHFSHNGAWSESVGGEHLRHVKSIEVKLTPGDAVEASGEIVGKKVKWKIVKGKHGIGDGAEGSYKFIDGKGVDLDEDTIHTAIRRSVVSVAAPYFSWGGIRKKGLSAFSEAVIADGRIGELRKAVFDSLGVKFRVR